MSLSPNKNAKHFVMLFYTLLKYLFHFLPDSKLHPGYKWYNSSDLKKVRNMQRNLNQTEAESKIPGLLHLLANSLCM